VVSTALTVGVSILFEAGLSFLGLGDANTISWGYMIGSSRTYLREAWWAVTFPGLAIFVTVLSLSLVGDVLNDLLDPVGRQERRAS
jgi:peptide/nickel transport system permease protein